MPRAARAGSTHTRASSTWMPTASMPPSSIPVSACSPAPSRVPPGAPAFPPGMCRAYTRGLADYCKPYPERLFGVAMLPMQSVELAVDEMRYAREQLGMRGGFLRPNPYYGKKMISAPLYEPFWKMAEDLDFSIGFHEGSTNAMPTVGVDRFEEDRAARHMVSHTMEMML